MSACHRQHCSIYTFSYTEAKSTERKINKVLLSAGADTTITTTTTTSPVE